MAPIQFLVHDRLILRRKAAIQHGSRECNRAGLGPDQDNANVEGSSLHAIMQQGNKVSRRRFKRRASVICPLPIHQGMQATQALERICPEAPIGIHREQVVVSFKDIDPEQHPINMRLSPAPFVPVTGIALAPTLSWHEAKCRIWWFDQVCLAAAPRDGRQAYVATRSSCWMLLVSGGCRRVEAAAR